MGYVCGPNIFTQPSARSGCLISDVFSKVAYTLLKNSVNIRTYHSVISKEPVPFTTIPFVYGNPWNEHLFRIFTEHCTPEMLLPRPWI